MTVRIFTVKRLFIFIFVALAIGLVVLQQNFRALALSALNTLASPYDIRIKKVAFNISSIDHINFDVIELEYEDSHIKLSNIELRLQNGFRSLQNMSFNLEDITAFTIDTINVELGHSFLKRRFLGKNDGNDNESNLGLSSNKLPFIQFNTINIYWPDDKTSGQPFIQTRDLTLSHLTPEHLTETSALTSLQGKLLLMQQPLINVDVSLNKLNWELKSEIDLHQLIGSILTFNESVIERQSKTVNQDEQQGLLLLSKFLDPILSPIANANYAFHGQWNSQTTLVLASSEISSQNEITNIEISPTIGNTLNQNILFKPEIPLNIEISYQPLADIYASTQTSAKTSAKTSAQATDIDKPSNQISAVISPLTWKQTTTKQDLIDLGGYIDEQSAGFTAALLTQLDNVIINKKRLITDNVYKGSLLQESPLESKSSIDWLISIDSPITVDISLADESSDLGHFYQLHTNTINAQLTHPLLTTQLRLKDNNIALNDHNTQLATTIKLDVLQNMEADLSGFDAIEKSIIIDEFELSTEISAVISTNHKTEHKSRGSTAADNSEATTKQSQTSIKVISPTQIKLANLALMLGNKVISFEHIDWQEKLGSALMIDESGTTINLDSFALGFDTFSMFDVVNKDGLIIGDESLDIKIAQFSLDAQQEIQLSIPSKPLENDTDINMPLIKSSQNQKSLMGILLAQTNRANLTWQLDDISIDKLTMNRAKLRRYPALRLNSLNLEQAISLQSQLLTSTEQWQLDELSLSSYHLLQLPKNNNPMSVAGQWRTESDLAPLLNVFSQTQMLPSELNVSGKNKFEAGFALLENQGISLFEMKFEQSLTELEALYNDWFFYDGNINANCQFNWQQANSISTKTYSQSRLLCQETALSIAEAYVGINLENLNFNANISLGKDAQIPPKNWLQEISGLSDTEINLTASGKLLDGEFLLPEFHVKLQDESEAYLILNGISLQALLEAQPQVGVYADGIFDGVLPATLIDGKVNISGGHLAARTPGGLIQVSDNPALEQLKTTQPYLELVVQALEHLQYSELISTLDMQNNGDASIAIKVKGKSQDIERPIHLNYSHEENLFQLFKSTQIGNQLQNDIERSVK
ncbi:YdbH domain-containing protein [Shewanella donghaensis]|uniref:YdbH domain-containing protein n=1 Tax=Shewanella donghaensis TaxID=238836 RepID=UPI001182BC3B|nr:YdbH domain-containing protein [Shewanella donghaensis]